VLSNHDQVRHRTRYGTDGRARAAAVLSLTMRGTPFLYAGEELGLQDAVIPPERVVDPNHRDGCRAPIPWTVDESHGWGPEPWLPFPPDAHAVAYDAQHDDPSSMLHLYRRLLHLRRTYDALRQGTLTWLDLGDGMVGYRRGDGDDAVIVAVNFTGDARAVEVVGGTVLVSSRTDRDASQTFDGVLRADEAVALLA
jgi:alpha-glucosidase